MGRDYGDELSPFLVGSILYKYKEIVLWIK